MKLNVIKKHHYIIGIICLALILRLLGVWHGYPYSYYPDEAHFVKRALAFGSFDFNPHWFHKPAFYMYMLFVEYGIYFVIGKVIGLWNGVSEFAVGYIVNPGPFYMIGRLTTVLFSIGSIMVVYRIGERFFKEGTGIVAALLLSLSYGHVVASQDIKADTPAMFFVILSMFFLLNYTKEMRMKDLMFSAIIAGIGTATKKYSFVMLAPIIMGLMFVNIQTINGMGKRIQRIAFNTGAVLLVFVITYFVCAPFQFIDPLGRQFLVDEVFDVAGKFYSMFTADQIVQNTADIVREKNSFSNGSLIYLQKVVSVEGMGLFISGCGLVGIVFLMFKMNRQTFLFLLYPVLFMISSIVRSAERADVRHQLPLYPFLAIAGGVLIIAIVGAKEFRKKIVFAIVIISLAFPFYKIIERDLYVSKPDTRNLAKSWIESHISSGTKLLIDENGPQLLISEKYLKKKLKTALKSDPKGQFTTNYDTYLKYQILAAKDFITYDIDEIRIPWWREKEEKPGVYYAVTDYDKDMGNPLRPVGVMPYEFYKDNGYEYVVVSSEMYVKFLKENTNKVNNFPSFSRFYKTLFNEGQLIKEFIPEQGKSRGPVIKIFKVI